MNFIHILCYDGITVAIPVYHLNTPIWGVFWDSGRANWYSRQSGKDMLCFPESFVVR